ncbi:MAG: adenine nucleotide alpha hydrolase family protein [Thermoplasmata archaeon]|nr:adenine nucleotide alpha hydrolase family protein [Thermoplasmata archaeon]
MVSSCDRCTKESVIYLRYSGQHLCRDHFLEMIGKRVRKEVRGQGIIRGEQRIAVAVSGGKDSILLLNLLKEIVEPIRAVSLVALTVDEGIDGYRPSSLDIVREQTDRLGVESKVKSYGDLFGMTMDEMVEKSDLGPCTICGIMRRKCLNVMAKDAGCTVLATGHNLDDMAQTILMNVLSADLDRMARLGPHDRSVEGFIRRSMPLRTIPETETYLSAHLLGLPIHELECPYSETAKRGHYRDLMMSAEEVTPGSRHSLLKFQKQLASLISRSDISTSKCPKCGEPVFVGEGKRSCRACTLLGDLEGAHEKETS